MSAEYMAYIKSKKTNMNGFLVNSCRYNHPCRIASIALTGSMSYIRDERLFSSPSSLVQYYEYTVDFSLLTPLTRVNVEKSPWIYSDFPITLNPGEFTPIQHAGYPWRIYCQYGGNSDMVTVGSVTQKEYTNYEDPGDPPVWTETDSITDDLTAQIYQASIVDGGDVVSGGKGPDDEAKKAEIQVALFISPTVFPFPNFGAFCYRYPWDWPWAGMETEFTTIFSDFVTDQNAADGGGHSGSCSLEVVFS